MELPGTFSAVAVALSTSLVCAVDPETLSLAFKTGACVAMSTALSGVVVWLPARSVVMISNAYGPSLRPVSVWPYSTRYGPLCTA